MSETAYDLIPPTPDTNEAYDYIQKDITQIPTMEEPGMQKPATEAPVEQPPVTSPTPAAGTPSEVGNPSEQEPA